MPTSLLPAVPPLPVPHREQQQASDCLAACAAMVLEYLDKPTSYNRLLSLLRIGPIGAPRRNILQLTRLGIDVAYREATLPLVVQFLQAGLPVIAFVDTGELSYWSVSTNHALVLVGIDEDYVFVNDPAFSDAPKSVSIGEFDLAWLNGDNTCAILRTAEQ